MKQITVMELKSMIDQKENFQLIDVREPHEAEICSIQGELIPMGDIPTHIDKIARDKKVIIHCRSGARSGQIVQYLEANHAFDNVYNLAGGILGWISEIDPTLTAY